MRHPLILVFDDDLVKHRDFLAELPARFVYRAHADRCLEDVADVQPDAVFMDFSMGRDHLTGAQAVARLREVHDHDALTIIAISSDADCNRAMLRVGATEGVVKMILPTQFAALLPLIPTDTSPDEAAAS